jgi:hypothetical protein
MTIRAQEIDIGKCVVGPVSIPVMKFEGYWPTQPLGTTTAITTMLFEPLVQQPVPQSVCVLQLAMDQNLIERASPVGV